MCLCMYMYVYVQVDAHVYVCVHACGGHIDKLGIGLQESHPRDLPVSTTPPLDYECVSPYQTVLTWVLGMCHLLSLRFYSLNRDADQKIAGF